MDIKPGLYKHYKGGEYRVHFVALDEATEEPMVVYEALYENDKSRFWIRSVKNFTETLLIDGKQTPRFQFIKSN